MYKAVGFDLHGVVIGGSNIGMQFFKHVEATFHISEAAMRRAINSQWMPFERGEISLQQFWARVALDAGFSYDTAEVLEHWTKFYVQDHPVNHQVVKLVDLLRERGYKVGLLSNTNAPHVAINNTRGIFEHFDIALMSNEIGILKPDREAYNALIDSMGVKAQEMIFVDDDEANVQAAKRMGMYAVRFKNYHDLLAELANIGLRVM